MKKTHFPLCFNHAGQTAVEYLLVIMALLTITISGKTIYETLSHTMQDKYNSYAFGISISDPPSKKFDDEVTKDIDKVAHVIETLKKITNLIEKEILPKIMHGKPPSKDSINELIRLVKNLF